MRDYYVVSVVIGGVILKSMPCLLPDAEMLEKNIKIAAPNSSPQIIFDSTR